MQFEWVALLSLLVIVPLLVILYIVLQRRRRRFALRYASLALVKPALSRSTIIKRYIPPALFFIGLTLMLVAVARPFAMVTAPSQEGIIILAMDTSGSMRADDAKPSRFEAMRAAARTFIEKRSASTEIGIVAFAGYAALVQPPTNDHNLLSAAIDRMTMQRGTAIGDGITESLKAIFEDDDAPAQTTMPLEEPKPVPPGTYAPAIVILLSDGQSNRGVLPLEAAQVAADRGVRVYTVGLGTLTGVTLNNSFGNSFGGGRGGFRTELDEQTLRGVADMTHAEYFHAENETDLDRIYSNLGTELTLKLEKMELTALFTAGAGLLLVLAFGLSIAWWSSLSS